MTMRYHITKEEFEALPEGMRGEYAELTDGDNKGMYRLQLADNPVATFRQNNITQQKRIDDLTRDLATANSSKAQIEDALNAFTDDDGNKLDPTEVKRIVKEVASRSPNKKPDVVEAIEGALKPLRTQLELVNSQLEAQKKLTTENEAKAVLATKRSKLRAAVETVAAQGMADYLVNEMVDLYDLDASENLVPKNSDVEGNPITTTRFLDSKRQTAPAMFKASGVPKPGEARIGAPPEIKDGKHILVNPTSLEIGAASEKKRLSKGTYDYVIERQ